MPRRSGNPLGAGVPARDADQPWPLDDSIALVVVASTILWSAILGTALRLLG